MRKKYSTDAKAFAVITSIGGLLFLIPAFTTANPLKAVLFVIGLLFLFFLLFAKGYYVLLDEKILTNVQVFIRRSINVDKITDISIQQAYKGIKSIKSIYIFYQNGHGNVKHTEIRIGTYKPSTLKNLINDLKKLNPKIKLDVVVQKFMEKIK